MNFAGRKKYCKEIPQLPRVHAMRMQDVSSQDEGGASKASLKSFGIVDAMNGKGLSTRKEMILKRGVAELYDRAEGDYDFTRAIPKLLSAKYPNSCRKCGNKNLMVKEVAKQAAEMTVEKRTAEQTAEYRAYTIVFACATMFFGALFSSFAAFYDCEFRKMSGEHVAKVEKTS